VSGLSALFLVLDLATRQNRVDPREVEAPDATTEIAGPQEKHHIGAVIGRSSMLRDAHADF